MTAPMEINPVSRRRRLWSAWRGKRRNKKLLVELARYNLELRPPERILAALGLVGDDLRPLAALADRPDGRAGYLVAEARVPGNHDRLAGLGLLLFKNREIRLTDAGRFLLSLSHWRG